MFFKSSFIACALLVSSLAWTTSAQTSNQCDLTRVKMKYKPDKQLIRMKFRDGNCTDTTITAQDNFTLHWLKEEIPTDSSESLGYLEIPLVGVKINQHGILNLSACKSPTDSLNCFQKPNDSDPLPCFNITQCVRDPSDPTSDCEDKETLCRCDNFDDDPPRTVCWLGQECDYSKFNIDFCPQNNESMTLTFLDNKCRGTYISEYEGVELRKSTNNSTRRLNLGGNEDYCIHINNMEVDNSGQVSIPKCPPSNNPNCKSTTNCWADEITGDTGTCVDYESEHCNLAPCDCEALDTSHCAVCGLP